jgi:hypothetical protein
MLGTGRRIDPRLDRESLDREGLVEESMEVLRIDVVRRVHPARSHVLAMLLVQVVVHGDEQPARADGLEQVA